MTTRRRFIKIGLAAGAAAFAPPGWAALRAHPRARALAQGHPLDPASLTKFLDPLPILPVQAPSGVRNGVPFYEIATSQFSQQLHAQLPPTSLWGYAGRCPGPTIEARVGRPIRVRRSNAIAASQYLIPGVFDRFMEGTDRGEPQVRNVVHLHGANVAHDADGFPDAWFTRGFAQKGADWRTDVYDYPNRQGPATLWYHDHVLGQTRLNIYAGLAGLYILRDAREAHAGAPALPQGPYEIALIVQDKLFDTDGSLLFPVRDPAEVPTDADHPGTWVPEFFGDTILVNGKVWPYLEVEPRRYRLRILNACNARFLNLKLDGGLPITVIGGDQGFLPRAVALPSVLVAPAQRVDVVIDFRTARGNLVLRNDANTPFPDGDETDPANAGQVMRFRVSRPLARPDTSLTAPPAAALTDAAALARAARVTRTMAIVEFEDPNDEPVVALLNNLFWRGPTSAPDVKLGSIEVWNIVNVTDDAHPIHLHQVHFQLLGRQALDAERYRRDWIGDRPPGAGPNPISPLPYLSGAAQPPGLDETGYTDTVRVPPGQVTSIVMRFGDYAGLYPWHCHILDHEDNSMMQRFEVS